MLTGINVNERVEFSSKFDKNDPKTVFILRPLTGLEMLKFSSGSIEDIVKMVEASIVSVTDFSGAKEIRDVINSLQMNVLGEVIQAINAINKVTEQDVKN